MDTTPINQVIKDIDVIIAESLAQNNALCLFAFIYKKTTERIKKEIELGAFEDNERMLHFDVFFANLYLDAYRGYKAGAPVPDVWRIAFDQSRTSLTFLQHILLGMSAHINYDLAITTHHFAAGKDINAIRSDFDRVNDILADLTRSMLNSLGGVSPCLFLLDWMGQTSDERLINFSIEKARTQAFQTATLLHLAPDPAPVLETASTVLVALSEHIIQPKTWLLRRVLGLIQRFETRNMQVVIRVMDAGFG